MRSVRLSARSIEKMNCLKLTTLALGEGYVAYLPVVDEGIDLILYREKPLELRKVQLKARWTIAKKYLCRDIWIAFPEDENWYMAPHDEMLEIAKKLRFAIGTSCWDKPTGDYHKPRMWPAAGLVDTILS